MNDYSVLCKAKNGDKTVLESVVKQNEGLVWSVVRRFLNRGYDAEDLFQIGNIGLIKAVKKFDTSYGVKFSTYAVPLIMGEIKRFLRDDGAVKVSRGIKEQASAIRTARSQLVNELNREPTLQEISEKTGFSPEEIALAETATAATESIQKQTGEDGFSLENILTDTESEERMVERISLRQAVDRLPQRERLVIQLRYYHGLTQERVAKVLSVSQVQVSRIEKKSLAALKELLR